MKNVRREFSAKTKREIWERANGLCEGLVENRMWPIFSPVRCNAPLHLPGASFHYDHVDPDWVSKDNEASNGQLLCVLCHKLKTRKDMRDIAKIKRIRDKLIKARKPKGRPLPGSKRSGIRRRMSGRVERW